MIFVSTRKLWQEGDPGWDGFIRGTKWPRIREMRTLDAGLNEYVDGCGNFIFEDDHVIARADLSEALALLPKPTTDREYYLLGVTSETELSREDMPGFEFLGCDLSDETMTSSLSNCQVWEGLLAPFVARLNSFGLLTLADARDAQTALPLAWGAHEPHASVDIWLLYGRQS